MFIDRYRELIETVSDHIGPEITPVFVEYIDRQILSIFDYVKQLAEFELKEAEISTLLHAGVISNRKKCQDSMMQYSFECQKAVEKLNGIINAINDVCVRYRVDCLFPDPEDSD